MNDYHDRLDEPHQGEDRPVAGWPGHNPDEHTDEHDHTDGNVTDEHTDEQTDGAVTDEHPEGAVTDEHTDGGLTDEHTDETREDDEPLVGEVWNDDAGQTDGERADVTEAERTEDTHDAAAPYHTEEPVIVDEPATEESDGLAAEQAEQAEPAEPAGVAAADRAETTGTLDETDPAEAATDPDVEPVAVAEPAGAEPVAETGARPTSADDFTVDQLVEPAAAERFRDRWRDVKAVFVDDPADAVRQAGALTGEAVDELTAALGRLRDQIEGHTGEGGEADTEKLRVALRGYGSLIERILTR